MTLKITLVTPSTARAQRWAQALGRIDGAWAVRSVLQPLRDVPCLVNGNVPDVAVLDLGDGRDVTALEGFVRVHASLQYVLVGDDLPASVLDGVRRLGVRDVQIAHLEASDVASAVQRLTGPPAAAEVLTLLGCKGGSGATFVAANLAHLLAAGGRRRVALIDLNLASCGDAPLFVSSQRPPGDIAALARNLPRLDRDLLLSTMLPVAPGLHVLAASEHGDEPGHPGVQPAQVRRIIELARQCFDLVVIDGDRRLDAVTRQALALSDRIGLVLQLVLPSLREARRLQHQLGELGHPAHHLHWIVNRYAAGGAITLDDVRKLLGTSELMTLPNHFDLVSRSVNQGVPVKALAPHSALVRALTKLAQHLDTEAPAGEARSHWLSSLWPRGVVSLHPLNRTESNRTGLS